MAYALIFWRPCLHLYVQNRYQSEVGYSTIKLNPIQDCFQASNNVSCGGCGLVFQFSCLYLPLPSCDVSFTRPSSHLISQEMVEREEGLVASQVLDIQALSLMLETLIFAIRVH